MKLRNPNVLTLREAEDEGYGTSVSLKQDIYRGKLPAEKVGNAWLVHRKDLQRRQERKALKALKRGQ